MAEDDKKGNYGYNAANETHCDMIEMGILDPTKVTRTALQNAASVASLMLTTTSHDCRSTKRRRLSWRRDVRRDVRHGWCGPHGYVMHPRLQVMHPRLQVMHPRLQVMHPRLQVMHPGVQVMHPSVQVMHVSVQIMPLESI